MNTQLPQHTHTTPATRYKPQQHSLPIDDGRLSASLRSSRRLAKKQARSNQNPTKQTKLQRRNEERTLKVMNDDKYEELNKD
jgi:hypothetical protein